MKVLVNGIENMGTTLLQVLTAHWDVLDAETILAHTSATLPRHHPLLERLKDLGVVLVGDTYPAQARLDEVAHEIDYVFDAGGPGGGAGGGPERRAAYDALPNLLGSSTQGGEEAFGVSYVLGLGTDVSGARHVRIPGGRDHAELAVLRALSDGHPDAVVARHITPHRHDPTGGMEPLPLIRFSVSLGSSPCLEQVRDRIERAAYVTSTGLSDPAEVFDVGRRFGLGGRLFHQAILLDDQLKIDEGVVHGSAFVPQEGNTVLSTMAAYLQRTRGHCEATRRMHQLTESLLLRSI